MSSLTHIEKQKLEQELGMGSGWVLDFSNRTFGEFFREVVGVDIFDVRYTEHTGSKANRMRAFWRVADKPQLLKLLNGLLEGWDVYAKKPISPSANTLLREIITRLNGGGVPSPLGSNVEKAPPLDSVIARRLVASLIQLSALDPQKRGYEFERFLRQLFDGYGLAARASFRLVGEQIDGSFVMDHETYLLEAKWQNPQTGAADLHTFEGKLRQKATWTRGLFVSNSGFSADGLQAFGKSKPLVCMDGFDLSEMLRLNISFVEVLAAKVRHASETGFPFVSVRDLFPR